MTDVIDEELALAATGPETRSCPFEYEIRSDTKTGGLNFEGYAALFGVPAKVYDHRGVYDETVERGAFTKTLAERKPLMLFEHGMHPLIRTMPVANLHRAAEDSRGVHIRGVMFDNWLTVPILDAMRAKPPAITGLSYNFDAVKESWSKDRSVRSIQELRLLMLGDDRASEISFTATPVQTGAQFSLRSILALNEIIGADEEIRSALQAALRGTSVQHPEPPPEHSVPETTLALWARVMSRRHTAA